MTIKDKKLYGIAELGEALKVSSQRASQLAGRDDFPEPYERLAMGPVWKTSAVKRWADKHERTIR